MAWIFHGTFLHLACLLKTFPFSRAPLSVYSLAVDRISKFFNRRQKRSYFFRSDNDLVPWYQNCCLNLVEFNRVILKFSLYLKVS
jgi:hypothetical protein